MSITAEACAWIAQLETGNLTSEDLSAFEEWIRRNPAHQREISRLAHLSSDANLLAAMAAPLKTATRQHKFPVSIRFTGLWQTRLAFACLALVFGLSLLLLANLSHQPAEPILLSTSIGSHDEVTLTDGSILSLNTNSQVEVDFNADQRKVRLIRGEVFFKVTSDAKRPFIVYAGDKVLKVIGTEFIVRLLPEKFDLTVSEGEVELRTTAPNSVVSTNKLKAGQRISYATIDNADANTSHIEPISHREIRRQLSWQDGLLEFSDTPLRSVVADLGRYTTLKIEISEPALGDLKFGGLFRTDELQALFDALESTFDIEVEWISDKLVRLSPSRKHQA